MKKILLAFFPILFLIVSCKKDKPDPVSPVADKPYTNTNKDTRWIYEDKTDSTSVLDTVTVTGGDTSINSRTYRIENHTNGNYHSYFNLTGNDYYRFENVAALSASIDALYLKDNVGSGGTWNQTVNLDIPDGMGGSIPFPLLLTYTITDKGGTKTVNGVTYNDVITVKTALSSVLLPITSDIMNYYTRDIGLIESDNDIEISAAGIDVHTQTLLQHADLH